MSSESFIHSTAWRKKRAEVLEHETRCYLCGRIVDKSLPPSSPYSASVDHVEARSSGGALLDDNNLHLVHRICNSRKSNLPLDVYRYRQARAEQHSREW
jgi:5-methylcytosine-specific restriction endonuclease McrA